MTKKKFLIIYFIIMFCYSYFVSFLFSWSQNKANGIIMLVLSFLPHILGMRLVLRQV